MMTNKSIYIGNECYGKIGKKVPGHLHALPHDLHVGDLVAFKYENKFDLGIVLNHEKPNTYGIYGYWIKGLDLDRIKLMYQHQELSEQSIKEAINTDNHKIKIIKDDVKELTLEEIQRLLGYKIKIIK